MKRWNLLCLTAALLLASCGSEAATAPEAETAAPAAETQAETAAAEADTLARYEQKDYGGQVFRVIAGRDYLNTLDVFQFGVPEYAGDIVNDALMERDSRLQEYFNISIEYEDRFDTETYPYFSSLVTAGGSDVSMVLASIDLVFRPSMSNGLLYDLNDMPELHLSEKWWDKNARKDFGIGDSIYGAGGSITTRCVLAPWALFFNTQLLTGHDLSSPYEMVKNGTWTLDAMTALMKDMGADLDGNSTITAVDQAGLAVEVGGDYAFFGSAGGRICTSDGETIVPCFNTEKNITLISKLRDMLLGPDTLSQKNYTTYESNTMFKENRTLFYCAALCDMVLLRDMKTDFGIVPLPKENEEQKEYYSFGNQWIGTVAVVPISVPDPSFAGTIMDAMAALSYETSLPAEYEITLQNKQTRDETSAEMLRLIVENLTWDWGHVMGFGGIRDQINTALRSNKDTIASSFAKKEAAAQKDIEKFTAVFMEEQS